MILIYLLYIYLFTFVATLKLNVEAAQRFIGHAMGSGPITTTTTTTPTKSSSDENVDNSNTPPTNTPPTKGGDRDENGKKISPGKRERSTSKHRTPKEDKKRRKK